MPGLCPTPEHLAAALRSRQPGGGEAELAAHLADCPACQAQLEALAGGSGWLEAKARTHASTTSESLRQAMLALESRTGMSESEPSSAPRLDFLQPSDQPGVLGRFGSYEVIAYVASGGMGIVLKARDPALDRVVALKILSPALAANALARARFVREGRAAAAVVHEHVVPIYAVAEFAGLPYLVMQFIEGCSLAERIRATGPLRLEEILRIGAQTAAGLAAAHAQGLIHRDIKPGNILLENSVERVKLTDFGLARAVEDVALTRTGELAGTPEFMAPEQAGNEAVDHRSDLFSLGSVLYAMCTSHSPFRGSTVVAVIRKVCDSEPLPLHEINPDLPHWLNDIIARLMAKAPAERFQSAKKVSVLLERYLARVQHGELGALPDHWVRQEPKRRKSRAAYAIGAMGLLAIVGLLIFAFKHRHTPSSVAGPQAASLPPFVVRDEQGNILASYADMAEAVRAAPPAGVVELRWNGPREMPPVALPAKPLALRPAEGFRPTWVHTNSSVPALAAGAALTLENTEFVLEAHNSPLRRNRMGDRQFIPSGTGMIVISNAPLRLSHCVVQLYKLAPGDAAVAEAGLAGVVLDNAAICEIENSMLSANPGMAILWRGTNHSNAGSADETRLSLSNCVVAARQSFWIELPEAFRARLQMVRCTFDGPGLIRFSQGSEVRAMTVTARANLFATRVIIRDDHITRREGLASWMRWQGSENLFGQNAGTPAPREYIILASGSAESRPLTLAQWNRWWPQSEAGSREVTVRFARGADARTVCQITDLQTGEEPALPQDQWSRFGADTGNVGPRSIK